MNRSDVMSFLYSKRVSPLEFKWDTMVAPPLLSLLSPYDIVQLNQVALDNKLASKPKEKYNIMNSILEQRGFKKMASGTNRAVYKFLEDQRICLKVAYDRVALKDNPAEFNNQFLLKPFVTKTFEVSPCGTVALSERVKPITSREEYSYIAGDVFDLLIEKIIGKCVVDDIGTNFFQNIGIRVGYGPVLLDYPYVFELDGRKMFCNRQDPMTKQFCLGEIDYDDGFNFLICKKCGKKYQARQLAKQVQNKSIVVETKGVKQDMRIRIVRGYGDEEETINTIETKAETDRVVSEKESDKIKLRVTNLKDLRTRERNKKDFEERKQKAIEAAHKKKDDKVKKNIEKSCTSIYEDSKPFEEPPKPVEVNLGALARINGMSRRFERRQSKKPDEYVSDVTGSPSSTPIDENPSIYNEPIVPVPSEEELPSIEIIDVTEQQPVEEVLSAAEEKEYTSSSIDDDIEKAVEVGKSLLNDDDEDEEEPQEESASYSDDRCNVNTSMNDYKYVNNPLKKLDSDTQNDIIAKADKTEKDTTETVVDVQFTANPYIVDNEAINDMASKMLDYIDTIEGTPDSDRIIEDFDIQEDFIDKGMPDKIPVELPEVETVTAVTETSWENPEVVDSVHIYQENLTDLF